MLGVAVLAAACSNGDSNGGAPSTPAATATPAPDLTIFRGFIFPIAGACLPESDLLMPNAPRAYRDGIHEGVDFYPQDNCTFIDATTPIVAAKDGTVIRADHDYTALTQPEFEAAGTRIADGEAEAPEVLDLFRGRQVWIDHGDGIVTRYAHTSAIPGDVQVGSRVAQGQTIAFVGDSGTPESLSLPGSESHLHFELRVRDSFLGAALPPDEVRALYTLVFTPVESP